MKLNKFTVILAILLVSIMAIGAVSAESVDDFGSVAATDGDIQESVDVIDAADDLGTADTADETVEDAGGAVLGDEAQSYDIDDDTYATYFNDDGTANEALSADGNYVLNIGNLTNKDIKIASGSNIYIQAKEKAGVITNGTITIGDYSTNLTGIFINGLTFKNFNKNGIIITQNVSDVSISQNNFNLTYDNTFDNAMAIMVGGYVDDVRILGNTINMNSDSNHTYGIDLAYYYTWYDYGITNAEHFLVTGNTINILATTNAEKSVAEAMYLDTLINSEISNNIINVKTVNAVPNYAMQLADSWGFTNDEWAASPYNVTISNNTIVLDSADMAYGITVISLWSYTEDYMGSIIKDIVISGNDVTIISGTAAVGIGSQSSDVLISDNKVTISADPTKEVQASADPVFGDISYAIFVNNFDDVTMMGYFVNNTVTGNTIVSNVQPIKATKEDENVQPLVIGNNIYVLNDDTYATYFNDDGTAKDSLDPMGNYTLFIDTLNNKDIKIASGSNIYIGAEEDAGIINNGSITIGNDVDELNLIFINGLTFNNFNKNGITLLQNVKDSSIAQNTFNLTYDDSIVWPDPSPAAITVLGYVDDIRILGNEIDLTSDSTYTYGITLAAYGNSGYGPKNAEHFLISGNIMNIVYNAFGGMAEGIYLDTIANSEIFNNKITIVTKNAGAANYGIQLADSAEYSPNLVSPYNVTIEKNNLVLDSADMVYGITVISTAPSENSKDLVITNNDVNIVSATGAIGIGAVSSDVSIKDNAITLTADPTKEVGPYTVDRFFGNTSYGIFVNNDNEFGTFNNTTVTGNNIATNVEAIKVAEEENEAVKPLVIEDNEAQTSIFIDDDNYATYFNEDGSIKDDAPITPGIILLLGDLTNKKLVIDTGVTIRGVPNKKLVNSTITLIQGADNTVIEDLDMEFTGDDTTGSIGIIYIINVNNVTIQYNRIVVPDFADLAGYKYGSSVYAIEVESGMLGCNDIFINNNEIYLKGTCRYLYGIDAFLTWGSENRIKNINIFENYVNIDGSYRMAEGIYVSECDDVIIDGNTIDSTSNGAAYGISTDRLTNAVIASNIIRADAATQAYGIVSTTSGSDIIIRANDIDAKGTGAVGIGINNQDGVTIEDNTIAIDGGDYTSITVSDSLGTANAGILVGEGNTNVEMSGNDVTEVSALRLDTVIEVSDLTVTAAPSGNGSLQITLKTKSGMLLANQVVKVVFNSQMYELTTDANGVAVFSFPLNKAGTYNVDVFYLGDDDYRGSDASAKITINKVKTALTASGKTFLATATTKKLTATLKDAKGNPLAKKTVTFTVNGKTYKATTNAKGVATVKLALKAAKTYTVKIKFAGDNVYAASTKSVKVKLNKEATKITAPKKTFKRTAKTKKVVITLKNSKNKAVASKKITLTVNKKKYTVKTNKKGQATFKVALTKKGTFKYTVKFAGDTQYKAVTKKTGKIVIK